jgi:nucleotide-binding universal stress UspA family protein
MQPKDVQLYLRAGAANARRLAFAARMGRDFGARISGLCLVAEPDLPFFDDFAIGPDAVTDVLNQRDEAIAKLVAPTEAEFHAALAAHGYEIDWDVANIDTIPEILTRRARLADLSIIGWPLSDSQAEHHIAETLVMQSATPCLVVPETGDRLAAMGRIVVAWDGSHEAARAMIDSMDFLKWARAVEVVVVDEPGLTLCDEASLGQLLNHLLRHDIQARRRRVDRTMRHVGEDLLRACDDFAADVLVMGAFGHGGTAERVFGGATRWILSESAIPVLLSH